MSQGFPGGDPLAQLRNDIRNALSQINSRVNDVAAFARGSEGRLQELQSALDRVSAVRQGMSAPGVVRIEDIPGKRIPYVLLAEVPIDAGAITTQQQSVTISQDGPFVAVRRMATFCSFLEYEITIEDDQRGSSTTTRYPGRSFGRYRPIHSAWDIMDAAAQPDEEANEYLVMATNKVLPNGLYSVPTSRSAFRTMEFDGRIEVVDAGSSIPRQNIPVPSSMWTPQINAPQDLGCLDFFERGQTITFKVTPTHENNPKYGNVEGGQFNWLGSGSEYPFLSGQYDTHEGIMVPGAFKSENDELTSTNVDAASRAADGVLILGFEGYRIIQPVAP